MVRRISSNSGCRRWSSPVRLPPADPLAGDGVEHRELQLVLAGVEVDEQVVDLVQHLPGPGVLAVDLVDDHDRRQLQLERLAQHEAGLRQRPLAGVHQQQHAVHHLERALDLAAEVGVARGVHDVDLGAAVAHRRVLRQDGDALFALEVVRVHHALDHLLVLAEHAALPEHGVHQGGLAVVHVRDDGDVAQVLPDRRARGPVLGRAHRDSRAGAAPAGGAGVEAAGRGPRKPARASQ